MREALRVMKQLILKGSINDRDDAELFSYASGDEARHELDIFAEEWDAHIVRTAHDMYLVPLADNEMFNVKLREVRKNAGSAARNIDAYLQCYIIMVILWMFFKSKNNDPQSTQSLRIKEIVEKLEERFAGENEPEDMENVQIDFGKIKAKWNNSLVLDDGRKNKTELVRTACRFLEAQKLVMFFDGGDEIRSRRRLTDLMTHYYLNEKRIEEINEIFDKENKDAGNQQSSHDKHNL